ncbi:MarR family transcriptional regulator [Dactylosporangium sp. AC04546]|uniref:MarR family winged helix-turn-helix transcriptional regulator n=1 Tax=Dactylosporangium sp. AC04546 TaxID=2862460 RepID=UPI001EDFDBCD|nr:MarR family transcriptional regulator [Dactylosporangium sp. AC04546]WVK86177.1 MarR family transcriptional regulator [Dactylosporangium sp. AC04546]
MEDDVDRILGQWARERPDLQTEAMGVFGRIYRLARVVGDRQEKLYGALGINRGEFDVLATLRRAGAPFQLSPKALSASLMLTTGGMTGRLDRLERAGLVTRSPDPADRRGLVVTLTGRGRELIDEAVGIGLAAQREVLERLPEADRQRLSSLLRDLLAVVE